jgi:hypothetical protein
MGLKNTVEETSQAVDISNEHKLNLTNYATRKLGEKIGGGNVLSHELTHAKTEERSPNITWCFELQLVSLPDLEKRYSTDMNY